MEVWVLVWLPSVIVVAPVVLVQHVVVKISIEGYAEPAYGIIQLAVPAQACMCGAAAAAQDATSSHC